MATRSQRLKKAKADLEALRRAQKAQRKKVSEKLKLKNKLFKPYSAAVSEYNRASNKIWALQSAVQRKSSQISNIKDEARLKLAAQKKLDAERKEQEQLNKELMTTPWYKWIKPDGQAPIAGGAFRYSMPKGDQPGEWHTEKRGASACNFGFHATKPPHVSNWNRNSLAKLYLVEVGGKADHEYNKAAFSKMRVMKEITGADKDKIMAGQAL